MVFSQQPTTAVEVEKPKAVEVEITRDISIFLDGAVKNLQSAGSKTTDVASTGTVGFRFDNELYQVKISLSAYSSTDTIFGDNIAAYTQSILNTGLARSGLGSFSLDYAIRFFSDDGFKRYLVDKKRMSNNNFSYQEYNKLLEQNNLLDPNVSWFNRHCGLRLYVDESTVFWQDQAKKSVKGYIIGYGAQLTYFKKFAYDESQNIDLTLGLGVTFRSVTGDLSGENKFREGILSFNGTWFGGFEIATALKVNNAYAKLSVPVILNKDYIPALTSGQFLFSLGVLVDIGSHHTESVKMEDLKNYGGEQMIR